MTDRIPERQEFLSDLIVNFVEGGPYSWFGVRKYAWYFPDLAGGTAVPGPGGGPNAYAEIRIDPEGGEPSDETLTHWRPLTVETIATGFEKLKAGPIAGLNEEYRARLIGSDATNDAGELDINDVDIIVQAALLGEIVYA